MTYEYRVDSIAPGFVSASEADKWETIHINQRISEGWELVFVTAPPRFGNAAGEHTKHYYRRSTEGEE